MPVVMAIYTTTSSAVVMVTRCTHLEHEASRPWMDNNNNNNKNIPYL